MLKVAVTGGIGSGKTLVCKIFEKFGIPVFYADIVSKEILNTNPEVIKKLKHLFGNEIYQSNGAIHRKKLAGIIFNDKFALQKVNDLVHPIVRNEFHTWSENQKSPYVIQEAAIFFENNLAYQFDKIITVTAPLAVKIERAMNRDNSSKEQILERMQNQFPDEEKIKYSDFVITNDCNDMILKQILEIHKNLI